MSLTHLHPVGHLIVGGKLVVEHHASAVVVTVAEHIAAESTLTTAALSLDEIKVTFLEGHVLLPNLRVQVVALGKDLRENGMKLNLFHYFKVYTTEFTFPNIGLIKPVTVDKASLPALPEPAPLPRLMTIANF